MKRVFDIVFSFTALLLLSPLLIVIALLVGLSSKGGVFYRQSRVGKNNHDFKLFKFRTMHTDAEKKGLLTVGGRDPRITPIGYYLRKYKLDELPQLLNVLFGSMSLVGPRPEVRKYVELYNTEQKKVLLIKPGITDYASLQYFEENELLSRSKDPEETYIKEIMPAKLELNKRYIKEAGFITDIKIIWGTVRRIFSV
ncbi:MAG: sugar transferase [Bacteroidia bacterium]|nr:sugar transferase [Bacteroidia bacterium]